MERPAQELSDREIAVEGRMSQIGAEAYRAGIAKAQEKERETTTPAGRYLLRVAVGKVARGIEDWLKLAAERSGPNHQAYDSILDAGPDVAALIACKAVLDAVSRQRGLVATAVAIGRRVEDELVFRQLSSIAPQLFGWGLRKTARSGYEHRRRVLRIMAREADDVQVEPWAKRKALRVGMVLLDIFIEQSGLVEETEFRQGKKTIKRVQATSETLEWLEKAHDDHEFLYPFWMPTYDAPLEWVGIHGGGYHTDFLVRRPLVRFQRRAHLRDANPNDYQRAAAAVNVLQMTPWALNEHVYEVMRHLWEAGVEVAGLPSREDFPLPTKPTDIDTNEDRRKDWRRAAAQVYERNVSVRSSRLNAVRTLMVAQHYLGCPAFYFPHHLDWRGRAYPIPSFLTPQGTDFARGLMRFAHGKPLDEEGARWLMIHGANCWGNDKVTFADRCAWVAENDAAIKAVAHEPLDNMWWTEADKPWQFLAFCFEWCAFRETGYGFSSHLPVQMDGSNNGLQIYSLLMRDPDGARATNVSPTDVPQDIYDAVALEATDHLKFILANGGPVVYGKTEYNTSELAEDILRACDGRLPRQATKRSVMTLPYGARLYSCRSYVRDWLDSVMSEAESTFAHANMLAPVVWGAIEKVVTGADKCMKWLQECAKIATRAGVPLRWTAPNGFKVTQEYTNYRTREIKTTIGDRVRWSNLREDTDRLRLEDQVDGVCPNFVHSLDAACLTEILLRGAEQGISHFSMIHDSYGTHAADAGRLANIIRGVYADVFEEDLLAKWRDEVQATLPEGVTLPAPPERGPLDVQEIRRSPYSFA
jgi:DNA-directed RNA polymerase